MILGTGVDIIEVARVETAFERFGKRFLERVLRPAEIEYCLSHKVPGPFLAARFAAKEAVLKALGTGLRDGIKWKDIEVINDKLGKPCFRFYDQCAETTAGSNVLLSISHTAHTAAAFVVIDSD